MGDSKGDVKVASAVVRWDQPATFLHRLYRPVPNKQQQNTPMIDIKGPQTVICMQQLKAHNFS